MNAMNLISEVVSFDHCPLEWHWRYNRGRTHISKAIEKGALIHDLFNISCDIDKRIAEDLISKIERGNSIDIKNEITEKKLTQAYMPGVQFYKKEFAILNEKEIDQLKNSFLFNKARFERNRMNEMFYSNLNFKKALEGIYINSIVNPEIIDEDKKLIGRPDKIEFHEDKPVPIEMKLDGFLDHRTKRQMQGELILTKKFGDAEKSILYLFFPKKMIEYKPSEGEIYEFMFISDSLLELKKKEEILAKDLNVKAGRMQKCRYSPFYSRCSPCLEEAIERRGEIVARKNDKGNYIIGKRKTIGIEGILTQIAIDDGNTRLKMARVNEEFEPLSYWTKRNGIKELEDELKWMEKMANDYSTLRLFFTLFFGLKENKERSIDTISAYMNASNTSIATCIEIGKKMGWIKEQQIINPLTQRKINVYRRKKAEEMTKKEKKSLNEFKREIMEKLRACNVPYTTFCEKNLKQREEALKKSGIIKSIHIVSSPYLFEDVVDYERAVQLTSPLHV